MESKKQKQPGQNPQPTQMPQSFAVTDNQAAALQSLGAEVAEHQAMLEVTSKHYVQLISAVTDLNPAQVNGYSTRLAKQEDGKTILQLIPAALMQG
jgi:hypothetical protein